MSSKIEYNRILKNTLVLYFRMFFQMIVYLYTSRVLINVLGFVDYGIYDVAASLVISISSFELEKLRYLQPKRRGGQAGLI